MHYQIRPVYPNELMHSGVKGQKWGQRRYQNPDGTLTAEGKARYKEAAKNEQNFRLKRHFPQTHTLIARNFLIRELRNTTN